MIRVCNMLIESCARISLSPSTSDISRAIMWELDGNFRSVYVGMAFALSPTKNKMWIKGTINQTGERCGRYESSPAR